MLSRKVNDPPIEKQTSHPESFANSNFLKPKSIFYLCFLAFEVILQTEQTYAQAIMECVQAQKIELGNLSAK